MEEYNFNEGLKKWENEYYNVLEKQKKFLEKEESCSVLEINISENGNDEKKATLKFDTPLGLKEIGFNIDTFKDKSIKCYISESKFENFELIKDYRLLLEKKANEEITKKLSKENRL